MTDELKAALQKAADDVAADARVLADARIATLIMVKSSGMPAGQTLDRVEVGTFLRQTVRETVQNQIDSVTKKIPDACRDSPRCIP
jgi:hypothetical protein